MKPISKEWLKHASADLEVSQRICGVEHLTNVAAFHAQQVVEKSLKAIIDEYELQFVRTHDLERLYAVVRDHIELDRDILDQLDTVYIDARYPSDFGLMPLGPPDIETAKNFLVFAEEVYHKTLKLLG